MRRLVVALSIAGALVAAGPGTAFADVGRPGTTFPEQPGGHVSNACVAVTTNPGSGFGGQAGQHDSPTAIAITTGLLTDACF